MLQPVLVARSPQCRRQRLRSAENTALPVSYTASVLRPDLFGTGGFGSASFNANGEIIEAAGTSLNSPGGIVIAAASVIDLQGSIDVPGARSTRSRNLRDSRSERCLLRGRPAGVAHGPRRVGQ